MNASQGRSIMLIGAGRVGMNLLRHLKRRGFEIATVVEPDLERHASLRSILPDARVLSSLPGAIPHGTDICILAVPDDAIRPAAEQLAQGHTETPSTLIFHVSGLRDAAELQPFIERGAAAGGVHPMQSFTDAPLSADALNDIGCGIIGDDTFQLRAQAFAESAGWRPLRLRADQKALYHAACVFAGNFPVVLAALADQLLRAALEEGETTQGEHLRPMTETVSRRLRDMPPEQALSGPAARGDLLAIGKHLAALRDHGGEAVSSYADLTRAAARIAQLPAGVQRDIETLIQSWVRSGY